jgi:hypothetical protein
MTDNDIAELRPTNTDLPVRDGWVTEEIRWDGRDHEIAYDPRHHQILRASPDTFDPELLALFETHGWRRFGVDTEGAELWVRDLDRSALAHLGGLCTARVDTQSAGVAGSHAVDVD